MVKPKVKEYPILFSGAMVRAILSGKKTQTRRLVKLNAELMARGCTSLDGAWVDPGFGDGQYLKVPGPDETSHRLYCPFGYVGDRLWVRETWSLGRATFGKHDGPSAPPQRGGARSPVIYRADGLINDAEFKWRPSLHMPRWACRIKLEIVGVRVERVKNISHDDAVAEGCYQIKPCDEYPHGNAWGRAGFSVLWDSINKERGFGWNANPWVWVIEFKKG